MLAIATSQLSSGNFGSFKAIQRSFTINANSTGQIVLKFTAVKDQAKVGGIVIN